MSNIPSDWDIGRQTASRVIEVADTFIGKQNESASRSKLSYLNWIMFKIVCYNVYMRLRKYDLVKNFKIS